jgi:TPP-dependent pyruvate/acetoin dehydrogenase alpha subunit
VAAGEAALSLGTDTAGSIRQPAAFCGVVGVKPTYGRVSRYGLIAFASSLDCPGPLARDVSDAALMLQVIAGADPRDATAALVPVPDYLADLERGVRGLRIGLSPDYFRLVYPDPVSGELREQPIDPEIEAGVRRAAEAVERAGAVLVGDVPMPNTRFGVPAYFVISRVEAASNLHRYDGVKYGYRFPDPVGDLKEMYRLMLLDRRFSEHVLRWYKEGRCPTGLHPNIGQEAIGVGVCYGLRREDWVIPSLRTSCVFWTRGVTPLQQLNAMFGNAASISRGKETAHHATYPQHGILPGTAIVGGSIPVAVGAALALRMQGTDNVVVDLFGDGASNRGDFHEALNLAAVLKAPVVFVCENNLYAQMVPSQMGMAVSDIADRAIGYGMPGRTVDGQDVLAVYDATQEAVARARRGEGPTLLECKTYRFLPHYPIFAEDRPR